MIPVIRGCIGIFGAETAAETAKELLAARFPARFLRLFTARAAEEHAAEGPLPEGAVSLREGLYQALWLLGEREGCGIIAEQDLLPFRQEVIEVCELLGLNPCLIPGSGYVRLTAEPTEGELPIGRTARGNARVIKKGESLRYLPKPKRGN